MSKHRPHSGAEGFVRILFVSPAQFHSARYIPPANKRDHAQVLLAIQSDVKNSAENLSFLPHDALRMVEEVATAVHQAGFPGTDRVVRALEGHGLGAKPNPPPGPVPAALTGELPTSTSSGQNPRKLGFEEESTQITAIRRIFLNVGAATMTLPPHTPFIYMGLEGAEMQIEYTALDLHEAYLLAESLVATLAKSGIPEARRLAKQLKERR